MSEEKKITIVTTPDNKVAYYTDKDGNSQGKRFPLSKTDDEIKKEIQQLINPTPKKTTRGK